MGVGQTILERYVTFVRRAVRDLAPLRYGTGCVQKRYAAHACHPQDGGGHVAITADIVAAWHTGRDQTQQHLGFDLDGAGDCGIFRLPRFWFGLVLIITFSLKLGWLPSMGSANLDQGLVPFLKFMILPASSLALSMAAVQTRMIRSSMLDVLGQDYVRYARSKGLKRAVLYGHALKNAMIPVITTVGGDRRTAWRRRGYRADLLVAGRWPLTVNSITKRDYPMIQGITLLLCFSYLMINLIVDILYGFIDPNPSQQEGLTGCRYEQEENVKLTTKTGPSPAGEIGIEFCL